MTLHEFAKRAEKFAADNSPAILTAMGVTGTLTTAYLTGKATFKAAELINEEKHAREVIRPVTDREKFELVWKLYIPAASTATLTIACIITANRIGTRRAAAMAAAYSISEKAIAEYKDKVIEKFGESKEREVRDEVAADQVRRNPVGRNEVVITGNGTVLFLDSYSQRYFDSDMESVKHAQNEVNYMVNNNFYASLNDFYDKLGLSRIPIGDEVGWNTDGLLDIVPTTTVSDDNRPCFVLNFKVDPIRDYYRVH